MRAARCTSAWLALSLALAACSDGGGDTGSGNDALAAGNVAAALDASSELSRLVVPLEASADLGGLTADAARIRKIQNAITAFRALAGNPLCVKVATDTLTFLDVTFDQCRVALVFTLDGSLHAGIAVELAGGLPSALVTSVTVGNLVLTGPLRTRQLAGAFELRQAIPPAATPVELSGDLRFVNDAGAKLALSLGAEWTVANGCVTFTGGAQLTGDLPGAVGSIALSGEGVQSCRDQCPTAGSVELSYGRGALLAWTYTGASTVEVEGPRGKRALVPLACGGS